jgi:two-component system chemotaxis sensor kinase CheA
MDEATDFLARIRAEFYDEADDLLDQCEEGFLRLEDPDTRAEELSRIFRAAHTIKGSGAAVGLVELVEFAHLVEDCLAGLRAAPEKLTVAVTSLLLRSLDALRVKVRMLRNGTEAAWPPADLLAELLAARTAIAAIPAEVASFGFFDEATREPAVADAATIAGAPAALSPASAAAESARAAANPSSAGREPSPAAGSSVKIDAARVDSVLDLVGELVVIKSQLITRTEQLAADPELSTIVTLLDKTVRELHDKALAIRLTPLKASFTRMRRCARDVSVKIGRQVELETHGEDTELDRTIVESLGDPLMHLIRNAVDHGIESPDERRAAGKAPTGRVNLTAERVGGRVVVRIEDDGRGIDCAKVLRKAQEQGLVAAGAAPTEAEIHALILLPGFSTADAVTDVSGRGVGLDVVRAQIERLKGALAITSKRGKGTRFELSLPLTASITDGMVVEVAGQRLIVPMDRIRELVEVAPGAVTHLAGGVDVLRVRGELLPIVDARRHMAAHGVVADAGAGAPETAGADAEAPDSGAMAVVFENKSRRYALRVAGVVGQMQVVMKPLDAEFSPTVVAGAAILGDGQVALVADVDGLVAAYHRREGMAAAA